MGGNGGGGFGEILGIAHGMWVVEGCGRMWLRKMRQKWEKNGTKQWDLLPIFALCKNQLTTLTDEKMGIFFLPLTYTQPPRRLVEMLGI